MIFNWQGASVAAAVVAFPLVFKAARTAFDGVDRDFENAGRTLGYSELTVFTRVTFPLDWRGIAAGAMLAFARAKGEFGATLMIAGDIPGRTQTLSIAIYGAVNAERGRTGQQPRARRIAGVRRVAGRGKRGTPRRGHLRVQSL